MLLGRDGCCDNALYVANRNYQTLNPAPPTQLEMDRLNFAVRAFSQPLHRQSWME
jgi:hypothetical protein